MDFTCPYCDNLTPHRIEKYCPKCDTTLPHTHFHKNKSQPDGLHGWCKTCRNVHHKLPEEQQKRQRLHKAWYEDNREHSCAYAQQWRLDNPERVKETDQRYNAIPANKAKKNAQRQERYDKDPSKPLANSKRRRARKKNAPINDLTAPQWEAIKQAYNFRCVYCPPTCKACHRKTHRLTQEHLTPLSKNGSHTVSNVVPACHSCNTRRQNGKVLKPVQPLLML
jgi:hypothetical protein